MMFDLVNNDWLTYWLTCEILKHDKIYTFHLLTDLLIMTTMTWSDHLMDSECVSEWETEPLTKYSRQFCLFIRLFFSLPEHMWLIIAEMTGWPTALNRLREWMTSICCPWRNYDTASSSWLTRGTIIDKLTQWLSDSIMKNEGYS